MEKLMVVYHVLDGCTYSSEEIIPLEYQSAEELICDFADWAAKQIQVAIQTNTYPCGTIRFGNKEFDVQNFVYHIEKPKWDKSKDEHYGIDLPDIFTLNEWFEKNKN